ncbi:hypothetical protein [Pedobacter nutrimenti]|uniref:Uncharacterized protein n=1 Tax=Pedobacter nutrimenti TaxID=1241337 RepID=A0A318UKD9_9SPHI|nr:hypothetical protein [Pedobacter nutrimenti]PYF68498.1 hypothetical protein B0O44_11285 [Pedobacter nutrimenti]
MIKVKHPLDECNINQENFINSLPEPKRRFKSLMFSHGNAAYRYHLKGFELSNKLDFEEWIEGLDDGAFKSDMKAKGFEKCKTVASFTRHVQERNNSGFDKFIENLMGTDDYKEYMSLVNC